MPRKLLFRTKELPYHLTARSNNKEWFYLPTERVWSISLELLESVRERYGFQIHLFVLMSNHFHLIGSTPSDHLGAVMNYFMRETSKRIGANSGRINRIFGARYHWSVLDNPVSFCHAYKYVIRNPVEAGMIDRVEDYPFSTFATDHQLVLDPHRFDKHLPPIERRLSWLNEPYGERKRELVRRALRRTTFSFTKNRVDRHLVSELNQLPFEK